MVGARKALPDPLLAHGPDEVPHARLREVLIVVLDELGVNGGNSHEDVDHGSLGAQQQVPHLGGDRQKQWKVSRESGGVFSVSVWMQTVGHRLIRPGGLIVAWES